MNDVKTMHTEMNIGIRADIKSEGGLGIFIMKKFLDEIQYITSERANILRLVKFRKDGVIYPMLIPISSALKRLKEILFPTKHKVAHNKSHL